jgi:hypothetical protein
MSVYSAYNIGRAVGRVQDGKVDPTFAVARTARTNLFEHVSPPDRLRSLGRRVPDLIPRLVS